MLPYSQKQSKHQFDRRFTRWTREHRAPQNRDLNESGSDSDASDFQYQRPWSPKKPVIRVSIDMDYLLDPVSSLVGDLVFQHYGKKDLLQLALVNKALLQECRVRRNELDAELARIVSLQLHSFEYGQLGLHLGTRVFREIMFTGHLYENITLGDVLMH